MEIWILCHHFEWQGRLWSMELEYNEALCKLTVSTRHAGKLIRFSEQLSPVEILCILGVNVNSVSVLVRK